jgi:hypothetical protein
MESGPGPGDNEDLAAAVAGRLESVASADHEARLETLEDLYRSLETELETAGSQALQQ